MASVIWTSMKDSTYPSEIWLTGAPRAMLAAMIENTTPWLGTNQLEPEFDHQTFASLGDQLAYGMLVGL